MRIHHSELIASQYVATSRRALLQQLGTGLGTLGLAELLGKQGLLAQEASSKNTAQNPLAPRP
ncbi:MAG: hypothetical protein ACKOAH_14275, partial [Pirellula sp.]